ncbi:MAG: isocitrate/isopropylmalate family dehydrogenase [Ignavibacteriales bacterium]|nr:isocitrate/isopropylmalate family dehydrogenase [Ignavibacteriales bacterium]
MKEALRVLDAAGFDADYVYGDIGWEFWCREGNPFPQRTIDLIEKHKIALFGAITSKPNDEAKAELASGTSGQRVYLLQVRLWD